MRRRFIESQRVAFPYLRSAQHPALFMEMRLGKTLVTIRRCELYKPRNPRAGLRVLVVAPNSALGSWHDELCAEGYSDSTAFIQASTKEKRREILFQGHQWNLINKEAHRALPELAEVEWDAVILDESTFIKNAKAGVSKFYRRNFRDVPHRWILTGRPNPESDLELFEQMSFLHGSWLGCKNFWQFRTRFFTKTPFDQYEWVPRIGTTSKIRNQLATDSFILRREDVNLDIPKLYTARRLEMPTALRRKYAKVEEDFALEIQSGAGRKTKLTKFATQKWIWMRQLASGFVDGKLVWRGKVDELLYLLDTELKGQQLVVFFAYNTELAAVAQCLKEAGVSISSIIGSVKTEKRRSIVKSFRKSKFQVLLMQVELAKMGLDLSCADTAVYFSAPSGGEARLQSEDRIIHPNKVGKVESLLIIDLCTNDSVDVDLLESLRSKNFRSRWTLKRVLAMMDKRRKLNAAA